MTILRTEEWTTDYHGMFSTLVVEVLDGDIVYVASEIAEGLKIDTEVAKEVSLGLQQRFVWVVPYETVKTHLIEAGFSYVGTS